MRDIFGMTVGGILAWPIIMVNFVQKMAKKGQDGVLAMDR